MSSNTSGVTTSKQSFSVERTLIGILLFFVLTASTVSSGEFRFGLITPPAHSWTRAANAFAKDLEESTGGEHSIVVFASRQLGNEAQMLQLLQTGALDIAILTVSEISNRVPEFSAFYTPYLVKDVAAAAVILRSELAQDMLNLLPEKAGVFGMGYCLAGMRQIVSRDSVASIADIRGKKIRITPFAAIRDFYLFAGMAPTPMPLASVFDAFANGQIDALDMDLEATWKLKFYDYAHSVLITNHMMFPALALLSGKTWLRLSENERNLFQRLMHEHLDQVVNDYLDKETQWEADLRGAGVNVSHIDPGFFGDTVARWEAKWVAKVPGISELKALAAEYYDPDLME